MSAMDNNGRTHGVEVRQLRRGVGDPPLREDLVDEPERAAIGVVGDHDVVPGPQDRPQGTVGGGHARAERPPIVGFLDRGQRRFERGAGRIAGAGVLVSTAQPADTVLGEGGTGIDRCIDGAGRRIGAKTCVNGLGGEPSPSVLISHHRSG
jgi:hypothetical protein